MQPDARKLLWDALQATDEITAYPADRTLEDYLGDSYFRSAVERQMEIVGEALGQLARRAPTLGREIPDLPRVVAFRNILAHQYRDIDDNLVWDIVQADVPRLRERLRQLIDTS